jgi:hypothetical protein
MSIALNFGFAGRFDLVARKVVVDEDGSPLIDGDNNVLTGESRNLASFENLILDSGLNRLGNGSVIVGACVGTGTTAPANSQTALANLLRVTTTEQSWTELPGSTTAPYYAEHQVVYRFAAGAAAGNLSEVGLGWGPNVGANTMGGLWCRALIKDSQGNPTTITVLSDEVLDIVYTLQLHPPTSDITGTFNLSGEAYQYTMRPSFVNNRSANGWSPRSVTVTGINSGWGTAFTGGIGAVTSGPSGAYTSIAVTPQTYVNDSKQAVCSVNAGLNATNLSGGIRSIDLHMPGNSWQAEFSRLSDGAAIPKNNTNVLTIPFWVSWDRANVIT